MTGNEIRVWATARPWEFRSDGGYVTIPENWIFVPAGDPGLTRRLKAAGKCYVVVHKRRNRIEATGLWTLGTTVEKIKAELAEERACPQYAAALAAARQRRIALQDAYVVEFRQAVVDFLNFAPAYEELAWTLADAVTDQAIPVGSGTVARTGRIPLAQRAEAAVIAWMRHQTTEYDRMHVARIRGERRAVRRTLAAGSREILDRYRAGLPPLPECPLQKALK